MNGYGWLTLLIAALVGYYIGTKWPTLLPRLPVG